MEKRFFICFVFFCFGFICMFMYRYNKLGDNIAYYETYCMIEKESMLFNRIYFNSHKDFDKTIREYSKTIQTKGVVDPCKTY